MTAAAGLRRYRDPQVIRRISAAGPAAAEAAVEAVVAVEAVARLWGRSAKMGSSLKVARAVRARSIMLPALLRSECQRRRSRYGCSSRLCGDGQFAVASA